MLKTLRFDSPYFQFTIGVFVNVFTILILLSSDATYNNIQLPEGKYQNNIWKGNDVGSYIILARNYIQYGVVGEEDIPSSSRTIGYPMYLALMMKLFGKNWILFLFFFQAVLFALIYPIFTKIIKLLFGDNKKLIIWTFLFLLLSGAYLSNVPVILTDTIFTVLLTTGIYFGMAAIVKKNWLYFSFHVLLIGFAGQIRPILFLYAIPNLFLLIVVAKKYNILRDKEVRSLIISSSILLLLICNLPTLRNYINYSVITPATVLQDNMFQTHATKILIEENQDSTINELYSQIDTTEALSKTMDTKVKNAIEVYKEYPFLTVKLFTTNIAKLLVLNHYIEFAHFWGYSWHYKNDRIHTIFKKSNLVFFITIIFAIMYLLIYLLLASFLIRLIKMKKYFYLISLLIFISYFIFPVGFVSASIRFRLPIEGFVIMFSLYELQQLIEKKIWFKKASLISIKN